MAAITPEMCVGGRELSEPRLSRDGTRVVYASADEGVACLVVHSLDGSLADRAPDRLLATEPALRAGRGLGGGAWCFTADETAVVYVGAAGDLWLQSINGGPARQLTRTERSVSSPCCGPNFVVYEIDQAEIHQLFFESGADQRIDNGSADFCLDPFVGPSAAIRWLAWNVPDMPWDRTRVQRLHRKEGNVSEMHDLMVAGGVQQPREMPDGRSICVRDDDGWLNVWVAGWPVVVEPFEHARPTWGPGQHTYAWSPDCTRVAFVRNERGFGRLCVADIAVATDIAAAVVTDVVMEVARGVHGQLSWSANRLACLRTGARTPQQVVVYDTATWERTVVAVGGPPEWSSVDLAEPQAIAVPVAMPVAVASRTSDVHARLYKATGSARGLIVWLHGGPTDQWPVAFTPRFAYWCAQGWNILVPDHRGSTGHGRAYQRALRGQWGVLDVYDTLLVTKHAQGVGWGSAHNTVVMGSSAGGLTALEAVAAEPQLFAAAALLFPVTDLTDQSAPFRFEQHYNESLIGPLPAAAEAYRDRSPIEHADRFTNTPLMISHGEADSVVSVEQSILFADRVRAAGGNVELHVYEGEGHGFRQRVSQLNDYQRVASFLARHVPLASAE